MVSEIQYWFALAVLCFLASRMPIKSKYSIVADVIALIGCLCFLAMALGSYKGFTFLNYKVLFHW